MKRLTAAILIISCGSLSASPADAKGKKCSYKDVVGKWVFATSIGHQMLEGLPPGKDITAIGTMNIARDGSLTGKFDFTVEDSFFFPGAVYSGSVQVNSDCTGTLSFITDQGSVRTDSIVLVSRVEFLGMSQDPNNLWTYQARRISQGKR